MTTKIKIISLSIFLFFLVAYPAQAQWVQIPAPPDSDYVAGLAAIGSNLFVNGGVSDGGQFGGATGFVFRSTDRGTSWTQIDSSLPGFQSAFVIDGSNLFEVRHDNSVTDNSGLFLSTDYGTSWQLMSGSPTLKGIDRLFESDGKLLAGTIDTDIFHAFISADTGNSWSYVNLQNTNISSFAAIDSDLFVGTLRNGVYRSTDNGISWIAMNNGFPFDSIDNFYASCNAIGLTGNTIFGGTGNGIFLTTDSGKNWVPANNGLPAKTSVSSFAESGANIFAGTNRGIFLSKNNGANWTAINEGLATLDVNGLLVYDTTLLATVGNPWAAPSSIWRRPLSDFDISAVSQPKIASLQIQSYPNPFSQATTISFSSPDGGAAEVSIVNLLGGEVARIFSGELDPGDHSFMWNAQHIAPGMYECVVRMNGRVVNSPLISIP